MGKVESGLQGSSSFEVHILEQEGLGSLRMICELSVGNTAMYLFDGKQRLSFALSRLVRLAKRQTRLWLVIDGETVMASLVVQVPDRFMKYPGTRARALFEALQTARERLMVGRKDHYYERCPYCRQLVNRSGLPRSVLLTCFQCENFFRKSDGAKGPAQAEGKPSPEDNPYHQFKLGMSMLERRASEDAYAAFQNAVRACPNYSKAWAQITFMQLEVGDVAGAAVAINEAARDSFYQFWARAVADLKNPMDAVRLAASSDLFLPPVAPERLLKGGRWLDVKRLTNIMLTLLAVLVGINLYQHFKWEDLNFLPHRPNPIPTDLGLSNAGTPPKRPVAKSTRTQKRHAVKEHVATVPGKSASSSGGRTASPSPSVSSPASPSPVRPPSPSSSTGSPASPSALMSPIVAASPASSGGWPSPTPAGEVQAVKPNQSEASNSSWWHLSDNSASPDATGGGASLHGKSSNDAPALLDLLRTWSVGPDVVSKPTPAAKTARKAGDRKAKHGALRGVVQSVLKVSTAQAKSAQQHKPKKLR